MCPEPHSLHRQQGSMLVIALFIIVVMTLLVASMSKLLQSSSEAVSFEVLGSRAFFAAQSGMERAVALIYPLDIQDVQDSITACAAGAIVDLDFEQTPGLAACDVEVNCRSQESSIEPSIYHFWLSSKGSCGQGDSKTFRTIEMEVWQ